MGRRSAGESPIDTGGGLRYKAWPRLKSILRDVLLDGNSFVIGASRRCLILMRNIRSTRYIALRSSKTHQEIAADAERLRALYRQSLLALVVVLLDTAATVAESGLLLATPKAATKSLASVKKAYSAALRFSARAVTTPEDCGLFEAKSVRVEALISKLETSLSARNRPGSRRSAAAQNSGEKAWRLQLRCLPRLVARLEKVAA